MIIRVERRADGEMSVHVNGEKVDPEKGQAIIVTVGASVDARRIEHASDFRS